MGMICRSVLMAAAMVLLIAGYAPGADAQETAAAPPLVTPAWVKDNGSRPGTVILDIRAFESYRQGHIPGSVSQPYNPTVWRLRFPVAAGAPSPERAFAARVAVMGISNASHVIIVHAGRATLDVSAATHVYWSFKLMGHEKISILHGGMPNYRRELGIGLETATHFPRVAVYLPKPQNTILATIDDVARAVADKTLLIDYRPFGHFLGINKTDGVARYGTLPGAVNFPLQWATIDGGGMLRSADHLKQIYDHQKINVLGPHIAFSDVGQLASLGWFVAHEMLGNRQAKLFAGGMLEWTSDPTRRVERDVIIK